MPFPKHYPRFIHFYDYVEWDSIRKTQLLKDSLGWEHPENRDARFDCLLHCYVNYSYLRKYNISHDGLIFCNFIRENKMTKEEALAREEYTTHLVYKECENVAEKIGVKPYLKYL